jgi:hypothetical protein
MDIKLHDRTIAGLSASCVAAIVLLFVIFATTGGGQDYWQIARSSNALTAFVQEGGTRLVGTRLALWIDNIFIVLYSSLFILLRARLAALLGPCLLNIGLGALLLTAFLDAAENQHILAMIQAMQNGLAVSETSSQVQMALSLLKFESSCLGVLLFSFAFVRIGGAGVAVALVFWLYILACAAIAMTPAEALRPLLLFRTSCFVAAFASIGLLFSIWPNTVAGAISRRGAVLASRADATPIHAG